jgi:hypothetical protein
MIIDPEKGIVSIYDNDKWDSQPLAANLNTTAREPLET